MNIASLFYSTIKEPLLFNVNADNVSQGLTPNELYSTVSQISRSLIKHGLCRGDKVLILTGNTTETLAFILATFNIGAIAIPVNPDAGHSLLFDIIHNMSPNACFFEGSLQDGLYEALIQSCRLLISTSTESEIDKLDMSINYISYSKLKDENGLIQFGDFTGKCPALIIHTSGSQGQPKIIQMTHENLFFYFHYHDIVHRQLADNQRIGGLQRPLISVFQPSHLAFLSIALQGLLMRRPTYLLKCFLPQPYLKLLSKLDCHLSLLVPSMYINLLQEKTLISDNDFSSLKLCLAIGEPCSTFLATKIEQAFNSTLISGYGLTECLPGIAHSWEDLNQNNIPKGSSGKLLFEEVKLVDENDVSGDHGELWIRNPTVYNCYSDKTLNTAKINKKGWFKTGDLFAKDQNGNFFHKGRIDNMFTCNGKNIYPAEIENILTKHPLIENACACGIEDKQGKIVPALLIQSLSALSDSHVINFYLKNGPMHAIPKTIKLTNKLPELNIGKIDRGACKEILINST